MFDNAMFDNTTDPKFDPKEWQLAADPDRPLTEQEERFFARHMVSFDLPATVTFPTQGGGVLKLTSKKNYVTLVAAEGIWEFALGFTLTEIKSLLREGGVRNCPGVGRLVATPRDRGRVRLSLVPQAGKKNVANGFSFVADLLVSEVLERL